jgi:excisionase family DNA binding protein
MWYKRPSTVAEAEPAMTFEDVRRANGRIVPLPANDDGRGLLSIREAAEYAGFSEASLRSWSDRGLVAVYRTPGGQRRFAEADLEEFIGSLYSPTRAPTDGR